VKRRRCLAAALLALLFRAPAAAQRAPGTVERTLEPIRYVLRFPAPQTNYVEVTATIPADGRASVDLMMPVWTPGSYLVREYARNVENVAAANGGAVLPIQKTQKNRWRVTANGARAITLTYRVYAHEMTVRSNWVEDGFAMLNGAPTFITLADLRPRAHDVRLELPAAWQTSVTGLPESPDGGPHHYRAPDFDTLVDCPIVAGNPQIHRFTVSGKPHLLVDVGEAGVFDGERAARELQKIVETAGRFWGGLPYDKYVFFNVLTETGGGLEHKNSVMMMATRWATSTRERFLSWLSTASHEFFHLWNVKRLRPVELGPFDYEHEVYTRSLWIAEGLTDYYADVILARAGIISTDEYLNSLSGAIAALQSTPGRLTQPVESASFDAWIKQYRPDENSVNTAISYYTKGAIAGFLLDARIRQATAGARSLDDVMRLAYQRYSGARGYTPAEFRATVSEVAGVDLSAWFHRVLETTEELDYAPALDWYGLEFRSARPDPDAGGWIGADTKVDDGRLLVTNVRRGTPAFAAGLNAGDEILGIGDFRLRPDDVKERLRAYRPGQAVTLVVSRREQLKPIQITLGEPPPDGWHLFPREDATPEQRERLRKWLTDGG
jgi:predicted metalloprotease with PDZ domain